MGIHELVLNQPATPPCPQKGTAFLSAPQTNPLPLPIGSITISKGIATVLCILQVIHCAGPFQRSESTPVLDACIATKTPYIDVCDDMEHAELTKSLHSQAQEAGVPCITTAGVPLPCSCMAAS